jgi:two-component system chemotaxis response regulator CheY
VKVLIVDDSGTMRHMERLTLQEIGISDVKEAGDGAEALKAIEAEAFDLVLMDWNMPNLSGIETLKQIKASPTHRKLPVVMVTSEAEKDHVLKAIQAGAADYILKPFSAKKLKAKLMPHLKA